MKRVTVKKVLKFCLRGLGHILVFTLTIIAAALGASAKQKEYEPTQHEEMCGEKMPISGEYFVPDDKQ